ncbi:hypothetical protein COU59_01415 [Candidatus Pacearchaeota archaeon CG10_big_fil_rev_8_21_14_0_10_34_12]|nr:MAG: hypothetical protein COU59_01415 [Candidatus Pacearchaeota archaeon CG10_big_fil_rev_8_21_14_0_10_34_12]
MPINAHPEYLAAEKEYRLTEGVENKIKALEKMISLMPKHKGAENLRAQLRTRLKKLKEQAEKTKKTKKSSGKRGIKKEEMQVVIVGLTNSGKSTLLSALTNTNPEISHYEFATKNPIVGMMPYSGIQIQIVEIPAIESEYYDKGIVHTSDLVLMLVNELAQVKNIEEKISDFSKNKIIVFNAMGNLTENEKRKISANLQSKKYNFVILSAKKPEEKVLQELKDKIFQNLGKIRVFTKQPGKEKSEKPVVLNKSSTIKDIAEKILHGFSHQIKETRIWGPSSKFHGQVVGLRHKLMDLDVVEFKTR